MVYCSINSHKRVYHTDDCWYTKRTKERNQIIFNNPEYAEKAGFGPCSCCCQIGQQYRKERREIQAFCSQNGFRHFILHGELYVISAEDTAWRIIPKGAKASSLLILYHESLGGVPYIRNQTDYPCRQYHQQKVLKPNIYSYLEYIKSHDEYRKALLEQRRSEREKLKNDVKQIHDVRKTIARQNRKRGKVKSMKSNGQNRHVKNQQLKMIAKAACSYKSAKAAYI